jgi:hypothetical protein
VSHRTRGILIGALAGALFGALIAWIYTSSQSEETPGKDHTLPQIAPADWIRLGIAMLNVARQIGDLVKRA